MVHAWEQFKQQKMESTFNKISAQFKKLVAHLEEISIRHTISPILGAYTDDRDAWYNLEDDCEDWYMDGCNFLDDNYFRILSDESFLSYKEQLLAIGKLQSASSTVEDFLLVPSFPYSLEVLLALDGYISLDPYDLQGHHTWEFMEL